MKAIFYLSLICIPFALQCNKFDAGPAAADTSALSSATSGIIDIPDSITAAPPAAVVRANTVRYNGITSGDAVDAYFEPIQYYISAADDMATQAKVMIEAIIAAGVDYPEIMEAGNHVIGTDPNDITDVDVSLNVDYAYEFVLNQGPTAAVYVGFTINSATDVEGAMALNLSVDDVNAGPDAYAVISFDTLNANGEGEMQVVYQDTTANAIDPDEPTKIFIEAVKTVDGLIGVNGGSLHPTVDIDGDGVTEDMVYDFTAVADGVGSGTKGIINVAIAPSTYTGTDVMSVHSIAAYWATWGCSAVQADATAQAALTAGSTFTITAGSTCADIISSIGELYLGNPTDPDVLAFFTLLMLQNSVYFDSSQVGGDFVTTQGLIDLGIDAAPTGYSALEALLATATPVVPNDITTYDLSAELIAAGFK